ncbi:PAS domain-containing protein [Rhizobium sp. CRIBSB]|nr:PAS domain-containing protein [Rhizobium sp. CRIBSB]
MLHSGTQRLIGIWSALPGGGRVPARADLDPTALGPLLPQAFMAERQGEDAVFRVAGGWIERLHGRSLTGETWLPLWCPDGRGIIAAAMTQALREGRPVIIAAETPFEGDPLEVVIAPMRSRDGATDRLLGLYQTTRFGGQALRDIEALHARSSMGLGDIRRAPLHLAAIGGRRVA